VDRSENNGAGGLLDDTVFIQGLPETATEELLAKHFSAAGTIKVWPGYLSTSAGCLLGTVWAPGL